MTELSAVVETNVYLAKVARMMAEGERAQVVDIIAAKPDAGVVLKGAKGLRKLRVALAGRGKSGGARLIYWYHSPGFPAVLLWVFAKNEADDLTDAQLKQLVGASESLIEDFGGRR